MGLDHLGDSDSQVYRCFKIKKQGMQSSVWNCSDFQTRANIRHSLAFVSGGMS